MYVCLRTPALGNQNSFSKHMKITNKSLPKQTFTPEGLGCGAQNVCILASKNTFYKVSDVNVCKEVLFVRYCMSCCVR